MKRAVAFLLLAALGLFAPATATAQPDTTDTRLLSQPAVSAKHMAFIYADDLWVADLDGKNPRQLTTDLGTGVAPRLLTRTARSSPSARSTTATPTFTPSRSPAASRRGSPLTPQPTLVRGFTPDGKNVLFSSNRNVYSNRHSHLFTVPADRRNADQLPIPWGFEAAYSPDGEFIAYTPVRDATFAVEALSRRHALAHLGLQRQDARRGRDPATEGPLQRLRPELDRQHASTSAPIAPASTTCSPTTPTRTR